MSLRPTAMAITAGGASKCLASLFQFTEGVSVFTPHLHPTRPHQNTTTLSSIIVVPTAQYHHNLAYCLRKQKARKRYILYRHLAPVCLEQGFKVLLSFLPLGASILATLHSHNTFIVNKNISNSSILLQHFTHQISTSVQTQIKVVVNI